MMYRFIDVSSGNIIKVEDLKMYGLREVKLVIELSFVPRHPYLIVRTVEKFIGSMKEVLSQL